MADQLETLVQGMLDAGEPDEKIREAVGLYRTQQQTPEDRSRAAIRAAQTESRRFPSELVGVGVGPTGGAAVLQGVGRLISRAASTSGAKTALEAAPDVLGLLSPRMAHATNLLRQGGRLLTRSAPVAKEAVTHGPVTSLSRNLILSPTEAAAEAQKLALAKLAAQREGMISAAGWRR